MAEADAVYVIKLEDIEKDSPDAGSKALAISGMLRAGFPVPPGFVLTRQAFEKFAKANRLEGRVANILKDLDTEDFESLREAAERIQSLVLNSGMPDVLERETANAYEELSVGREAKELGGVALDLIKAGRGEAWLAVRTSAIGDFAGQGKSLLNVRGRRKLSEAIRECWASLFTARAMLRRREKMIEGFPSTGVIVQRMVDSEKSGTIFTYQPETQDRSRIVVEGIPGLGGPMLDFVTPDEYILDKETGKTLERKVRRKLWTLKRDALSGETIREPVLKRDTELDALNESELIKLWELALRVERQDGSHAVEWGMERGRVFILNSRPITEFPLPMEESEPGGRIVAEGLGICPGLARGRVRIVMGPSDLGKVSQGDILVTGMTSDSMIPVFRKVAGIVTDSGGRTCHAARLARELEIPCMVGAETATSRLRDDQPVEIDGFLGKVYFREPVPVQSETHEAFGELPASNPLSGDAPATLVKVSLTSPGMAERVRESDGVGLLRAEHLLAGSGRHPFHLARNSPEEFERMLYGSLEKIARTLHPKPVTYRSLDIRTDEFSELDGGEEESRESNPMLGWHGIRRSLDEPGVFRMELNVLRRLHQNGMNNVAIALPFVSGVEELRRARGFLDFPIRTGIMIETPAAALNIENFCRDGLDFVLIGMDDLTQLVLGIDRDNPAVSRLYTEMNQAVVNLIRHIVRVCRDYGVRVSVCGEAGSEPASVERLVELGVDSVTSDPDSLEQVRDAVARAERRLLLDRARKGE